MQASSLFAAGLLVALSFGCKGKKDLSGQAGPADPVAQGVPGAAATDQVEAPKTDGDSVYFMIQRTACYGTCPTYRLTIYDDGLAVYEGVRFVARQGRYTGHVAPATMEALLKLAEAKGFFTMDDVYDKPVTDLPSVIIRVHADQRDKQVVGRVGAPQSFRDLAQEVENMLDAIEWTRTGDLR
ncbi:MAG: hypothetical protein J5I62_06555 [Flavobacteriales bacterium]|nr:hypothetical protein [Flavobacteriales bacterium]MEB2341670.1 DUF6438 domain-containing protein [Flavobacteriia bacterium]